MIALNTHTETLKQSPADIIIARVYDVFGKEKGDFWLKKPMLHFDGKTPKAMLRTKTGREEIQSILDKIAYAIY